MSGNCDICGAPMMLGHDAGDSCDNCGEGYYRIPATPTPRDGTEKTTDYEGGVPVDETNAGARVADTQSWNACERFLRGEQ